MKDVLSPLASLSDGWKHLGFKVFPGVENRKVFSEAGFSKEDLQVSNTDFNMKESIKSNRFRQF